MSDPASRRAHFVAAFTQTFGDRRLEVAQLQVDTSTGERKAAWLRILNELEAASQAAYVNPPST